MAWRLGVRWPKLSWPGRKPTHLTRSFAFRQCCGRAPCTPRCAAPPCLAVPREALTCQPTMTSPHCIGRSLAWVGSAGRCATVRDREGSVALHWRMYARRGCPEDTVARTHALTHALTHSHTHSRTHARTHALTHTRTHSVTHALTHARSHARTHTRTRTSSHARTLALTHTHLHILPNSLTCRHNTRARTNTHARVLAFHSILCVRVRVRALERVRVCACACVFVCTPQGRLCATVEPVAPETKHGMSPAARPLAQHATPKPTVRTVCSTEIDRWNMFCNAERDVLHYGVARVEAPRCTAGPLQPRRTRSASPTSSASC